MPTPRLIDTHAHLDEDIYSAELPFLIKRALDEGIWIVTIGTDLASSRKAVALAEKYPEGVYAAVGLHPNHILNEDISGGELADFAAYRELLAHPKVVAIGETGLDYADVHDEPRFAVVNAEVQRIKSNQRAAFESFLRLSREFRLPLLLHCREAYDETLDLLEDWSAASLGFDARGIVHCFSGDWKQARRFYGLDFAISFTGTLVHGAYQADILRRSPESRIAVESDCPYLTAMPWGFRRSEPSYLTIVSNSVAAQRSMSQEACEKMTAGNTLRILKRIKAS